jgi:hypothetical protein
LKRGGRAKIIYKIFLLLKILGGGGKSNKKNWTSMKGGEYYMKILPKIGYCGKIIDL